MDSQENRTSFFSEVLQRIILEVIGVAAFLFAWWILWQARDPTSWVRLRIAEVEDKLEDFRRDRSAVLQLREGIEYWEENGTS